MTETDEPANGGPVLLTSDVHLTPRDPAGIETFLRFLEGPAAEAAQVLLLGDLFDFWVSPAQRDEDGIGPVFEALAGLVERGVDVAFLEGNRDFAVTPVLRAVGVRELPDVHVLEVGGQRVVVTHGDLLCTDDVRYQAFRRVARTRFVRHLLRSAPPRLALGVGSSARSGSRLETARKSYGSMGLQARAVAALLRSTGAGALVCGHVHWGRRYTLDVDEEPRDVVVLSAWEDAPTYVRLDADGLAFRRFGPARTAPEKETGSPASS